MTNEHPLSDRLRAGSECAPWVLGEVQRLEARIVTLQRVATGEVRHDYAGACPDAINGYAMRDPDCPACQMIDANTHPTAHPIDAMATAAGIAKHASMHERGS